MNPTVIPEKHEPPALAVETPESLYHPSESSEHFESAQEVKGTCSSSEIPPGLTAETSGSFHHPCESSEDSDGVKEAKGSSREELNAFLACRDVSPVRHQLLTSWDSIARRTQRYHIRKARRVVITALEDIAPGNAEIVLNKLVISNDVAETEDEVDLTLVDALAECYKNASHWSTRRQILLIIVDKVSYRTLQSWIPGFMSPGNTLTCMKEMLKLKHVVCRECMSQPRNLTTSLTSSQVNTLSKNFHLVKGH